MTIRNIILSMSVAVAGLTASAQSLPQANVLTNNFKANTIHRKAGLNDLRNLSDKSLQTVGEHVSACGFPTKAKAVKQIRKAVATSSLAKKRGLASSAIETHMSMANYQASDTLFWESFEDWDGNSMPYVPQTPNTWSPKTNISNIAPYLSSGLCPTWTVYQGDGYYVPYATDRDLMLVCMYGEEAYGSDGATIVAPAPQQDEWIETPLITSIQNTNYLSFDICYSPFNTHNFIENNEQVFDMNRVSYDVEVLVSTSIFPGFIESNYEKVYTLSAEVDKEILATDMNDSTAVSQLLMMKWHHIQIPLEKYAGKSIHVAFRYKGSKGGSVLVDAVRVSDLLPVALFDRPEGSFYLGFSPEAALLNTQFVHMPAYTPTTWTNYSNDDAQEFMWRYAVDGESGTSKERDLAMPAAKPGMGTWPTLQANAGLRADEYSGAPSAGMKIGGDASLYLDPTVGTISFCVGNYDPSKLNWSAGIGSGQSAFGTGGGTYWSSYSDGYYTAVNGIANVFETPAAPYVFSMVNLAVEDYFNLGANLYCTIYRARDLGDGALSIEDEVIAETSTVQEVSVNGGGAMLLFNFPQPIVVDSPIAISITGFDDPNMITMCPMAQAYNHDSDKGYGFVLLRSQKNGVAWIEIAGAMASLNTAGNMAMSFCMGMNATFPYIHSTDGDVYIVENAGGKKSFNIDTYWNPNGDGKEDTDAKWTVACSDSWFKAVTKVDDATHTVSLEIEAEALPAGKDGRSGTVTVSALGCKQVITVLQGSEIVGIEGVAGESISKADGTYTLAGQRINSSDARKGIFLEKKNGKFVKVLKN